MTAFGTSERVMFGARVPRGFQTIVCPAHKQRAPRDAQKHFHIAGDFQAARRWMFLASAPLWTCGRLPMSRWLLSLVLVSVLMSASAQVVLKAGMSSPVVTEGLSGTFGLHSLTVALTQPLVLVGLLMYVGSAVLWLFVLARMDVSVAYPFVGLGMVATMLLAWWVHDEPLTLAKVIGTLMIGVGVVVVARS
jgi:multidrug transporter EmrE-like cation transporter